MQKACEITRKACKNTQKHVKACEKRIKNRIENMQKITKKSQFFGVVYAKN